jgi:two-component system, OmpR family, copper resistance phosphate regulon response regulator CusR
MKILLIEDEVKTVALIKEGLEHHQIEVDVAYDGLMGFTLAQRNHYSLIITDIILPEINGISLCKKLRDLNVFTPILLLTALSTSQDIITGLDAGADDYLPKPFEFSVLMARIRALTRRGGAIAATSNVLKFKDLELNLDTKNVLRAFGAIFKKSRTSNFKI